MSEKAQPTWPTVRLGRLAKKLVNGGTPPTEVERFWNGSIPWITGADFTPSGVGEFRRYVSEGAIRQTSTNVIQRGQLLLVTRTGVGKLAIAACDIAISQDVTGIYVDEDLAVPAFLFHRMRQGVEDLKKLTQGTSINGIIRSDLISYLVELPTLDEQRRIAEILSTLDEAIEQTEALVAKHQQIKAALMHDLFTRGVTPDGRLRPTREQAPDRYKESPLGGIPKEWEVVSFGSCLVGSPQNGLYKPAADYGESGTPIVRIDSFYEGVIGSLQELRRLRLTMGEAALYEIFPGEILVNRVNSIDYVGKSAIVPELEERVVFESNIMRCRLDRARIIPEFAIRWLCSPAVALYFHSHAKSAIAQASINQTDVKALPTILPNQEEQQRIFERADSLDVSLTIGNQHLDKLRQQKHGLMHDLLTGRVRVKIAEPAELSTTPALA